MRIMPTMELAERSSARCRIRPGRTGRNRADGRRRGSWIFLTMRLATEIRPQAENAKYLIGVSAGSSRKRRGRPESYNGSWSYCGYRAYLEGHSARAAEAKRTQLQIECDPGASPIIPVSNDYAVASPNGRRDSRTFSRKVRRIRLLTGSGQSDAGGSGTEGRSAVGRRAAV